jgi:hypothetical protein
MTPKDKAKELLYKMQLDWGCNCCHNDWAKECALIAVDEIIKAVEGKYDDYWQEVKQEINNI